MTRRSSLLSAAGYYAANASGGGGAATTALHVGAGSGMLQLDMLANAIDYNGTYTIMYWTFLDTAANNWHTEFAISNTTGNPSDMDGVEISDVLDVIVDRKVAGTYVATLARGTVAKNAWVHHAIVATPTGLTLFAGGVQVGAEVAGSSSTRTAASRYLTLLNWPDAGEHQPSAIYSLKAWKGAALTAAQITAEMAQVKPVNTTNFWAAFRFRDNTDLASIAGQAFTFTLTAGSSTVDTITAPNVPDGT